MQFRCPKTGQIVNIQHPASGVLLFGPVYFAIKGVWWHALLSLAAMLLTWGLSNIVYAYFAPDIFRAHFSKLGYIRVGIPEFNTTPTGDC